MTIIDRSLFFYARRVEHDIARIREIADRAISDLERETYLRRNRINALLDQLGDNVKSRFPCDTEPSEDQVA